MHKIMIKKVGVAFLLIVGIGLLGFLQIFYPPAIPASTRDSSPIYSLDENARFAVIGDFGWSGQPEADVANLVKSWSPDFIVTTGDNNYSRFNMFTIDHNIGQYYHEYIGAYSGSYGSGSTQNRFFPTLGNHDWHSIFCIQEHCQGTYLEYFSLPGNERYYDFVWGPVHFFILDSDPREPDGTSPASAQGLWLKDTLAASTSAWNVVVAHHPPYSSSQHGSTAYMQWPFKVWGADLVLSGHDHVYERSVVNGLTYIVNGLGGKSIYSFKTSISGSQVRFNQDYGAMLVEANPQTLTIKFITRTGQLVDQYTLQAQP